MTDSSKEDLDDVYDDLPDFHLDETLTKLEETNSSLQRRLAELEGVIINLDKEIKSLHRDKSALKSENTTLLNNISSLYKTAVAEVNRKDNIISELRKENYAFLKNQQVSQKNGFRNSSFTSKDQNPRSHLSFDRHEADESNWKKRNRREDQNDEDRNGVSARKRSLGNDLCRSRSRSSNRHYSQRSKDLRNSKLHIRDPSRNHSSKPSKSGLNLTKSSDEKLPVCPEKQGPTSDSKMCMTARRNDEMKVEPLARDVGQKVNRPLLESKNNVEVTIENTASKAPLRKFDTTFNKNLIVVDKSVPNTIYTKRLRKRILDQIAKENETPNEPPSLSSQSAVAEGNSIKLEPVISSNDSFPVIQNCVEINSSQTTVPDNSKINITSAIVSGKEKTLSTEKMKIEPVKASSSSEQMVLATENISEPIRHENNDPMINLIQTESHVTHFVNTIENCNNHTKTACNLEVTPNKYQNVGIVSTLKDSIRNCALNSLTSKNKNVNSSVNLSLDEKKKHESILCTVSSSSTTAENNDQKPSTSPMDSIATSLQNSSSSSLSTASPSSYAHCFQKFKKDGKTRINPIYIGPRILTQKTKVRPVSSRYSNLTNYKSPKALEVIKTSTATEKIENKTEKCAIVENQIFSLFGKTPVKHQPFISSSSNCLSSVSDNSLTNFSFLLSDESPSPGKKSLPKIVLESVKSQNEKPDNVPTPSKQKERNNSPARNQLSESMQSREEQMESLFGDVSSDSSSDSTDDEIASEMKVPTNKIDEKECPEINCVSPSLGSVKSLLPMQPKAEIIQSYLPKTVTTPDLSDNNLNDNNRSKTTEKTSQNISDLSLEKRSFDLSQIPNVHTPFKNINNSSGMILYTPARAILSPIPRTPQVILEKGDPLTLDRSKSEVSEKVENPHEQTNEMDCIKIGEVSEVQNSLLLMQPKAEIIESYLSKTTCTHSGRNLGNTSSLKASEKTVNNSDSSLERRSFDLSKIPVMHTPFKNTNDSSSLIMCTPAQALLSPIPATPQGMLSRNSISEKSHSSDHFKIIKASNSETLSVIIKEEANNVKVNEGVVVLSNLKTETDSIKKDAKSSSFEDGNSNLSINSAFVDKKIFLSPNSISAPSVSCTPFKTFSSDSLQSFMHTPARELLSPIPKTPLGSWDIDNDKTSSCDVVIENNLVKNSLSLKEITCLRDTEIYKSDCVQNGQTLHVSFPSPTKEENQSLLPIEKYFITQNEKSCVDRNSAFKPVIVSTRDKLCTISASKDLIPHHSSTPIDTELKTEMEPISASNLPSNSCNNSEFSTSTNVHEKQIANPQTSTLILANSKLDVTSRDQSSPTVSAFSPVQCNISENNISISSVNEQIQFQRTSKKVRKVVISSNAVQPMSSSCSRNSYDNSTIDNKKTLCSVPASVSKLDRSVSRKIFSSNSKPSQQSRSNEKLDRNVSSISHKKEPNSRADRFLKSRNEPASDNFAAKCQRAVLIPTDAANNISKNKQKNAVSIHKRRENAAKVSKRSRSPDKSETSPKKFKGETHKNETRSRVKTSSGEATKFNPPNPKQNVRNENHRKSRSSHRKSVDRSSRSSYRNRYTFHSHRHHDRRSRSVSRCRFSYSRQSVSKNLGSNYLTHARSNARDKWPKNNTHMSRKSSSLESSPPSTSSSHSESKKENRAHSSPPKNSLKPKKIYESPPKQSKILSNIAREDHRERTASVNSSLSSVSTFSDLHMKNEPLSFMDWKLSPIDLPVLKNPYESIFISVINKNYFYPGDPRAESYFRRSNSSVDENETQEPRATSTPKTIKRRSKTIKLGDSTQAFSPIKTTNFAENRNVQTLKLSENQ